MLVLSQSQLSNVEPVGFILMQILGSFLVFPVWFVGLLACLFSNDYREVRFIGWFYLSVFTVLLVLAGKPYYLLPAYLPLFAIGACVIEKVLVGKRLHWLRIAIPVFLFLGNSGTFAYGLPFLSIQQFEVYAAFMADKFALTEPLRWEDGELHSVRQDYADMLGWKNQVAVVAGIYSGLSVEEQRRCTVLASNYGQAGAIDFYGQQYGLPGVVSFSSSYYLWGARSRSGEILITVGFKPEWLSGYYHDVCHAATITHLHARENNVPVLICRRPYSNRTLQEIWPDMEKYRY
jgi:hypothetical protein